MNIKKLKKLFQLPGPKDLGMSDSNHAMPSEFFSNHDDKPTWEDYERRIKQDYPVRHFILYTAREKLGLLYRRAINPISDTLYWAKCNFIPRHKYHLIDLRGSKFTDDTAPYTHGWLETDTKMELAMFKLLSNFVEKDMSSKYYYRPTQEDIDNVENDYERQVAINNKANNDRIMELYNYWHTDRFLLDKKAYDATHVWSEYKRLHPKKLDEVQSNYLNKLWNESQAAHKIRDEKLDEMMHKLVDLRGVLWS